MEAGPHWNPKPGEQQAKFAISGNYNNMEIPSITPSGKKWERDGENREFKLVDAKAEEKEVTSVAENSADESTTVNEVFHKVNRHTDTLEGICLKYKTNRRAVQKLNRFSGTSLALAPDILKIPNPRNLKFQDSNPEETRIAIERNAKVRDFCLVFPTLSSKEARLYLTDFDWKFDAAAKEAKQDIDWENSDRAISKERKNSRFNERVDEGIAFHKASQIMDQANVGMGSGGKVDGESEPSPKATEMMKISNPATK